MSGLLDEEIVSELVEVMGEDINMLFETFIGDSENKISQLKGILSNGDDDEIRRLAHSLKGSCRNIGATLLADQCDQVETDAREGNPINADEAYSLISSAYDEVKKELKERFLDKE